MLLSPSTTSSGLRTTTEYTPQQAYPDLLKASELWLRRRIAAVHFPDPEHLTITGEEAEPYIRKACQIIDQKIGVFQQLTPPGQRMRERLIRVLNKLRDTDQPGRERMLADCERLHPKVLLDEIQTHIHNRVQDALTLAYNKMSVIAEGRPSTIEDLLQAIKTLPGGTTESSRKRG